MDRPVTPPAVELRGVDPRIISGGYADIPGQKVRYVQSTHLRASNSRNQGQNRNYPLASMVKANELQAAYDTIIALPGHIEVVSAAAGLDFNKPCFVHGMGGRSTRPQIKIATLTTAYAKISGADVHLDNLDMVTDIDALAVVLSVAAAGAVLTDIRHVDSATKQAVIHVELLVGANRSRIHGMRIDDETAGSVSAIKISGACDGVEITECILGGDFSSAPIDVTAAATRLDISRNVLRQLNASNVIIKCAAVASSGMVHDNRGAVPTNIAAPYTALITMGAGCLWYLSENYGVTVVQDTTVVPIGVLDA